MHAVEMPENLQDMLEDIRREIFDKKEEQGFLTDFDIEEIYKLPLCDANLEFMKNPYRSKFQKQQWWFVPPIIHEVQKIQKQPPRTRLPFIKHATKSIGHGMSGDVFRENIAIGHYCNSSGEYNTVSTCCLRFLIWH